MMLSVLLIKDCLVDLFIDAGILAGAMAIMAKGINIFIGAFSKGRIDI